MEDKFNIEYISNLARVNLSDQEKDIFSKQLDQIINYVKKLDNIDTSTISPMAHTLDVTNVYRDDEEKEYPKDGFIEKFIIEEKDGFFQVPKIIE